MKTAEETAKDFGLCNCDEAYTSRGLTAPDCPWHSSATEEAMEAYANQDRWIPVEENLPTVGERVIVYSSVTGIQTGYRGYEDDTVYWKFPGHSSTYSSTVTHWQPLPALPGKK